MSLSELISEFDYTHINKAPAVFDITKLRWMNGEYLKNMEFEKFYGLALPYMKQVIRKELDLRKIAALIKSRIETLADIRDMIDFFEELPDYDIEMYTHKKMKTDSESSRNVLQDLLPEFEALEDYSEAGIENVIMGYINKKGIKNGQGLWPVRTAVSGKQSTPGGAYEIMNILGKEESLRRIRIAIEKLS
jgi:glutamyl-tRNA synthetase